MKRSEGFRLVVLLGLIVSGMVVFAASPAGAATAAGPYYATPSWDQTLPAATRFIVLTNMGSAAVQDRETGLVWEQSPDTTPHDWIRAQNRCNQLSLGGRLGWRLPTIQDLASLIDPAVASPGPTLPPGHPFNIAQPSVYWSATTIAGFTDFAWLVLFSDASVFFDPKSATHLAWCVRGGPSLDGQ